MSLPRFACHRSWCACFVALALTGRALAQGTTAVLTMDNTKIVRAVDERVFGANVAVWDSGFATAQTTSLLAAADIRVLRFPGGSLSDEYHWKTNTNLANTFTWATGFDKFAPTAMALNARVFITVNYGTGAAQEAADWVTYANVTKGYGFKYWEIGNECYGTWETDTQTVAHDPFTYATRAKDYIAAMKAADPTVRVGVVLVTGEDSYANNFTHPATNPRTHVVHNGWTPVLLTTLKSLGVTPDFAIYHRYDGAPNAENDATLLQSAKTWPNDGADLRQQLNDYLGTTAAANVELAVTENNSVYSNPGKQTTSLVNGLFLADSVGNLLQTEFNSLVWWDVRNGQEKTNNNNAALYGWRAYGDYGILSTPSTGGSTSYYEGYPTYYALKLLSRFARSGDAIVRATSNNTLLSFFAARRGDGSLALLAINKSPTATINATIALTGFAPSASATTYSYGIAQDDAARTGSGSSDITTGSTGIAGATFSASFAPYSITVLSLAPTIASSTDTRLVNLSARASVGTGGNILIAGFVVGGTGSKPLLLRGIGPTLGTGFGVAGALADPQLLLFDQSNTSSPINSNDDWGGGASLATTFSSLSAFALPAASKDAALSVTIPAASYTAQVSGAALSTGVALAEIYDGDSSSSARLTNISARAAVGTGDNILIAGFVVRGPGTTKVLIRAIGPTLGSVFGVPGSLADPQLRLVDVSGNLITQNDDWGGNAALTAAMSQVFAFSIATNSLDSALLVTLPAGNYTAQVSGAGGSSGVALVEVYEVQ